MSILLPPLLFLSIPHLRPIVVCQRAHSFPLPFPTSFILFFLLFKPLTLLSQSAVLGYPRIGPQREVKKALEAYWGAKISQEELLKVSKEQRLATYETIKSQGVDVVPT